MCNTAGSCDKADVLPQSKKDKKLSLGHTGDNMWFYCGDYGGHAKKKKYNASKQLSVLYIKA